MLVLNVYSDVSALVRTAEERTVYGSGVVIGKDVTLYPAIQATFHFDNVVVCRIGDTDVWVRHDEIEGIKSLEALYVLSRPLSVILEELIVEKCYNFEVPEESEELEFDFHYSNV